MSEKEQQFERIYKKTESFGRTQFVREIQMQINENKQLKSQLQQKENIIKEVRKKIESVQTFGLRSGKTFIATLLNDIFEILDKENK